MANHIVQIELGTAKSPDAWKLDAKAKAEKALENKAVAKKKRLDVALIATFDEAARMRNAFARTDSLKQQRVERAEQAMKAIAKSVSTRAAKHISDHKARNEVRIRIYRSLMLLLNELGQRQEASAAAARRTLMWSFGIALVSILATIGTLIGCGIIPPLF